MPDPNRKMIGFVHNQKTAGTTLIYLLRENFFMRYSDVRVLTKSSNGVFQAEDLRKTLKLNPFLECFGGHGVKPYSNITDEFPNVSYITVLRDPIKRYLSHYQYLVEKREFQLSFEEFLNDKTNYNRQTQQIIGISSIEEAKKLLDTRFFLIGTLEKFDQFLFLLQKKLAPRNFKVHHQQRNVGQKKSALRKEIDEKYEFFKDRIHEHNKLDIELYEYVNHTILPKQIEEYQGHFEKDFEAFMNNPIKKSSGLKLYIDYVVRRLYYDPAFKIIRKSNNLPAKGLY